ncbi:MAG: hypothetical protein M3Y56_02860 [Armatimonadota bacterium]|nr:hypothetical protein [Armatimonadota bacterium]
MRLRFKVPEEDRKPLSLILNMENSRFEELEGALRQASLAISIPQLASFVAERAKSIDRLDVRGLVFALRNMYAVRSSTSLDVADFIQALRESLVSDEEHPETATDKQWKEFENRLQKLLAFETTVGISSKAFDVMSEHANTIATRASRILTDIRPIFPDSSLENLSEKPTAAVVVHTLKIVYHRGGEQCEFYVAMDSKDVRDLREVLDRADKKASILQQTLEGGIKMQCLEPEGH